MNANDQIRILFEELSTASIAIDSVSPEADENWKISCLQQKLLVHAAFAEESQSLTLTSCLQPPAVDLEEQCWETLLIFNGHARDQHGLRYGIDDNQIPVQRLDISTDDLDLPNLSRFVEFFVTRVALISGLLSKIGTAEESELKRDLEGMLDPSIIV